MAKHGSYKGDGGSGNPNSVQLPVLVRVLQESAVMGAFMNVAH